MPRSDVNDDDPRRPVVLLHGYASSPRVLRPLGIHLARTLGRPVRRLPISPGREDLRRSARAVRAAVASMYGGRPVDLVAHSMGGLVAHYLLKRLDRDGQVRRVVTLGTPHLGTPYARAGAWVLGRWHLALRQMHPGSDLVRELGLLPTPSGSQLVSVAGGRDRFVPPHWTRVAPAREQSNIVVDEANHWSLLFGRASLDLVVQLLSASSAAPELAMARAA